MPSGESDRPRQIDAFVVEVPGQDCDVLARAPAMPAISGSPLGPITKENLKLGSLPSISPGSGSIPKPFRRADSRNCRQCVCALATQRNLARQPAKITE